MNDILKVRNLCKAYVTNKIHNEVLHNINFTLKEGEFVSVMGASGSGKSTLLYSLSGMDNITSGEVIIDGHNIPSMSQKQLAKLRLKIMGFVFQQMYMMKNLCIMDNIILPAYKIKKESRKDINDKAKRLMEKLEVLDYAENNITEVSGGQLQRVCLCRAMINDPRIIFADEPTGALNSKAADTVMEQLVYANQQNTSIMMVTHSARVAAYSDKVIFIIDGGINGEYNLGKLKDISELKSREKQLNSWLMEQGW